MASYSELLHFYLKTQNIHNVSVFKNCTFNLRNGLIDNASTIFDCLQVEK